MIIGIIACIFGILYLLNRQNGELHKRRAECWTRGHKWIRNIHDDLECSNCETVFGDDDDEEDE